MQQMSSAAQELSHNIGEMRDAEQNTNAQTGNKHTADSNAKCSHGSHGRHGRHGSRGSRGIYCSRGSRGGVGSPSATHNLQHSTALNI